MNEQPVINPIPTPYDIERIAALTDPVIRNLQITQSYHELALVMTARTGMNANWCTFATWASKQAGQTIRREDFARTLEELLRRSPTAQAVETITVSAQAAGSPQSEGEIRESIAEVLNPLAAFIRAADAVARGNKKVYEEIGREFARFYTECGKDTTYNADSIQHFIEQLKPGEPPDGQEYLRCAFQHIYQAFFEQDAKTRAELMLLANVEIGLHEQIRLQPEIAEAMAAAFVDRRQFRVRLIKALFPNRGLLMRMRLFLLRIFDRPSALEAEMDGLLAEARRRAQLLITEYLMTIGFPNGVVLHLGTDVPETFPESLQHIALPDLIALLARIDPTPDSPRETGAVDWSNLDDRLHYIVDMFRCYHERADLFDPPFSDEQVSDFRAGRMPKGRL